MDADEKALLVQQLLKDPLDASVSRRLTHHVHSNATRLSLVEPIRRSDIARMIDHTILRPDATFEDVRTACYEARKHSFAAVCVAPSHVRQAAKWLHGTSVAVCTVIGFPLGFSRTAIKVTEAELALRDGATEIDMVIRIGCLKSGHFSSVERDIRGVVDRARAVAGGDVVVKTILETSLLTDEEKVIGGLIAEYAGSDYIKTSTGFARGGALKTDIALLRRTVASNTGIKASGGIKTFEQAAEMIRCGATRIGASRSVAILGE